MKFTLAIFFILFINSFTADDVVKKEKENPRIIGGTVCTRQDHRFVVSIRNQKLKHMCGGTLINKEWVLTAAHCIMQKSTVYAGLNYLTSFTKFIPVKVVGVYPHPDFNRYTVENDIALYRLASPLKEDEFFIQYVKLPRKSIKGDFPPNCQQALVMGWGVTNFTQKKASPTLQCVFLPLISHEACFNKYNPNHTITENMMCSLSAKEKDACQGDSGGPLLCGGTQYGIVSWGEKCADGFPGVYTRVDKYLDFINYTMENPRREESARVAPSSSSMFKLSISFVLLLISWCNL